MTAITVQDDKPVDNNINNKPTNNDYRRRNKNKKCIIIGSVILLVLIGIGLAVFFCFPRKPSVDFGTPTYSNLVNTQAEFSISVQLPLTVDNPNYYAITMKKLDMDVYYRGTYITNAVVDQHYKFKMRGNTESTIETTISTTDSTIITQIQSDIQSATALSMKFSGTAKLEALSISINQHVSFSKDILITE